MYITSIFILDERPKSVILRKMRKYVAYYFLIFIFFAYFCITALALMENYTFFAVSEADGDKSSWVRSHRNRRSIGSWVQHFPGRP